MGCSVKQIAISIQYYLYQGTHFCRSTLARTLQISSHRTLFQMAREIIKNGISCRETRMQWDNIVLSHQVICIVL